MDMNFSTEFEKVLQKAIKDNPKCHVLIDLKNVGYLSSSGLRIFVNARGILNERGFDLKVSNVNEACRKIFSITNFDDLIDVYETEEEAINSFK
jgi:anti-anti-sigma factor